MSAKSLARVRSLIVLARQAGRDEAEYLDERGMLLTGARGRDVQQEALDLLYRHLRDISMPELIGDPYFAGNATFEDVRRGVLAQIEWMAAPLGHLAKERDQ